MITMLNILRQHQLTFQKASSHMKNVALMEVPRDLLSLEKRTTSRLARLISKLEDMTPPTPGTYITIDSSHPDSTGRVGGYPSEDMTTDYRYKMCRERRTLTTNEHVD